MEKEGVTPDHHHRAAPRSAGAGIDVQLEKAVAVLRREVAAWRKTRPRMIGGAGVAIRARRRLIGSIPGCRPARETASEFVLCVPISRFIGSSLRGFALQGSALKKFVAALVHLRAIFLQRWLGR